MEAQPVFYKSGHYQFEKGGEMIGCVTQIGAEDLFEAFYYPLASLARDRFPDRQPSCSIGIAGPIGIPGTQRYRPAHENALALFYNRRSEKRREAGFFDRLVSRDQLAQRGRIKIKGQPWPRRRFCGGQIWCACWYEPAQNAVKHIKVIIDDK